MNPFEALKHHPALGVAPTSALASLAKHCEFQDHEAGANVVERGAAMNRILLLVRGALALHCNNRSTEAQIYLGLLEAPALFGDAEAYAETGVWMASGVASERLVTLSIPVPTFKAFVKENPEVAVELYADATARHMNAIEIAQILGLQKTSHKVLRLLWSISTENGGLRRADLSVQQLSQALGVNVKTVWRTVRGLEASGLLRREGRQVQLRVSEEEAFGGKLNVRGLGASWRLRR
jgi:CRP-like cAMP-binding protein